MSHRSITLSCMLMALMMTLGCEWKNGLYDEFVNEYDTIVRCPPEMLSDGGLKFSNIVCRKDFIEIVSNSIVDEDQIDEEYLKKCIINNKCEKSKGCERCGLYIYNYLSCKKFQDSGFFNSEFKGFDKLEFYIGNDNEASSKYPDARDYKICPADYPICSYKLKSDESIYGCIENNTIITECSDGQILCDEKCITPGEYGYYCGAKGNCSSDDSDSPDFKGVTCSEDFVCKNEGCVCDENLIKCDDKCINPKTNNDYCGAKGNCSNEELSSPDFKGYKCPELGICDNGICKCQEGFVDCDGVCINPKFDDKYCGAIDKCENEDRGNKCEINEKCVNGSCILMFCQDQNRCSVNGGDEFSCVDVSSGDVDNCGACNLKCTSNDTTDKECQGGICNIISCKNGLTKCPRRDSDGKMLNDFICIDTSDNVMYCGDKCNYCDIGEVCNQGKCEVSSCEIKSNTCLNNPPECKNRVEA